MTTSILLLIAFLDHGSFAVREYSERNLVKLSYVAKPFIQEARERQNSLEINTRLDRILDTIEVKAKVYVDCERILRQFDPVPYLDTLPNDFPRHGEVHWKFKQRALDAGIPNDRRENGFLDYPADREATKLWVRSMVEEGMPEEVLIWILGIMNDRSKRFMLIHKWE